MDPRMLFDQNTKKLICNNRNAAYGIGYFMRLVFAGQDAARASFEEATWEAIQAHPDLNEFEVFVRCFGEYMKMSMNEFERRIGLN